MSRWAIKARRNDITILPQHWELSISLIDLDFFLINLLAKTLEPQTVRITSYNLWQLFIPIQNVYETFLPINPKRISTRLIPPTVPETHPTVRINSVGSVDVDAMDDMKRKNPTASTRNIAPPMIIRQFLCLIRSCSSLFIVPLILIH